MSNSRQRSRSRGVRTGTKHEDGNVTQFSGFSDSLDKAETIYFRHVEIGDDEIKLGSPSGCAAKSREG